jgi:hypothetical protein
MNAQPVDHDLLVRFVGGALDDTPDGPVVAELVASDPAWTAAHDELVVALDAIAADLTAYAAVPEPMPDDVAARLDRVIADAPKGGLTAVPGGSGSRHAATVRRRRLPKWLAPVTIAAGLVAFGGFWLNQSGGLTVGSAGDSGGGAESGADSAAEAPAAADGTVPQRRGVSGSRYDPGSISAGAKVLSPAITADADGRASVSASPEAGPKPMNQLEVPPALTRLVSPPALASCLDAIEAAHGVAIAATTAVDYATWEDEPALMVFFTDANGQNWAWAAGPDCGASGPDTRYEAPVA